MKSWWAEEAIFESVESRPPMSKVRWARWRWTRQDSAGDPPTAHHSLMMMLLVVMMMVVVVVSVLIVQSPRRALVCHAMRHLRRWDGWRRNRAGQRRVVRQMKTRSAVSTAQTPTKKSCNNVMQGSLYKIHVFHCYRGDHQSTSIWPDSIYCITAAHMPKRETIKMYIPTISFFTAPDIVIVKHASISLILFSARVKKCCKRNLRRR